MADTLITKSLSLTDDEVIITCEDNPSVTVDVSGIWSGTLNVERTTDAGNPRWTAAQVFTVAQVAAASTITSNVVRLVAAIGTGAVKVRFNPASSGTAVVTLRAGDGTIGGAGGGGGGGAVTIADGADIALGATTDAGITTNIAGTLLGFARGTIIQWAAFLARLPAALISGRLDVNLGAAPATVTVAGTVTANAGTGTRAAGGDVAHDGVDSGNPVKMGLRAIDHGANPTAVAAADRTDWLGNRAGIPFVIGGHPNVQTFAQNFTTAQTDTALVTVSAGTKIVVTGFLITTHAANTVNVAARLGFGTANTPAYGAAQLLGTHPGIAPGSGFGRGGGSGIIGVGADNEDVRLTSGVPTGGGLDVMLSYFTVPS